MKVTKNIIPNKKKLQITVSSTTTKEEGGVTKFAIKTDEDAYLIYTPSGNRPPSNALGETLSLLSVLTRSSLLIPLNPMPRRQSWTSCLA